MVLYIGCFINTSIIYKIMKKRKNERGEGREGGRQEKMGEGTEGRGVRD